MPTLRMLFPTEWKVVEVVGAYRCSGRVWVAIQQPEGIRWFLAGRPTYIPLERSNFTPKFLKWPEGTAVRYLGSRYYKFRLEDLARLLQPKAVGRTMERRRRER